MIGKNYNPFWPGPWLESQNQYMDPWLAISRSLSDVNPFSMQVKKKNPMEEAMSTWWNLVSPALPQGGGEFVSKTLEQLKFFNILGEQFISLLGNISEMNQLTDDWQTALDTQFDELKKMFSENQNGARDAMHGVVGAWQLMPIDTFQRTVSSASVLPGDFFEELKPDALDKVTDKFLSIPGVGYTRESQEQIQTGIRLWHDYQKICNKYNSAMNKVSVNALEAMRLKIVNIAEQGKEIKSLREIYDLWVDCNEDAYADYVFTEEYSELYGQLTNALMAVKQHGRNCIDEMLGAFNMPTRRGMNTMQKRQQEIRREHKSAVKMIEDLQQELSALRKLVSDDLNEVPYLDPEPTSIQKKPENKNTSKARKKTKKKSTKRKVAKSKAKKKTDNKEETIVIKI